MVRVRILAVIAAGLVIATPCVAATADSSVTAYALITPPSSLQVGCQGPCACPIVLFPTYGSFELIPTGFDPIYRYYSVERYIASFNNGPGAVAITGSGQYKIGGESAAMQELTLDLQIEGRPTEHFDSGLKPVRVSFPQISVSCAVHGFYCYDSVLVVDAKPTEPASAPVALPRSAGLQSVWPNPFERGISVAMNLDRPEIVDLTVLDLEGRRVRVLAAGQLMAAGEQTLTWDGRCHDGRVASAGIYWVCLRWRGSLDRRRIVKLD